LQFVQKKLTRKETHTFHPSYGVLGALKTDSLVKDTVLYTQKLENFHFLRPKLAVVVAINYNTEPKLVIILQANSKYMP